MATKQKTNGILKAKQEEAIIALLAQPTIKQAAAAAGVGERTMHTWLKEDAAFVAAYRDARRQSFSHAVAMTQQYSSLAVNTLGKIMVDPAAQTSSKVAAASAVLRFGRESMELDDLAVRLEALEQSAENANQSPAGPLGWSP
jgi:hypothetical protein